MDHVAGGADRDRLLERDQALAMLRGAYARASDGEGQVVLVSGEAGVGKTALVRALRGSLPRDTRVLEGACDALFLPRPLGPFADVAAAVRGRLAEVVDHGAPPYQVLKPLVEVLEECPTTLVLEDLHWADEATLDVFRLLARRIGSLRTLVVATYRDEALTPTHPLAIVQGDVGRLRTTTRIQLRTLSPIAVATLAEPHGVDPAELFRSTGGNPFFVTEVLAAPGHRIPPTARDAVLTRVGLLSPEARSLLEAVAICPPSVDLALLPRLSEHAASLDECITSGMLVESGNDIVFRHELARLAVETSMLPDRRRALHRRALGVLAETPRGQPDLARLAHHAEGADDAAAVLRFAIAAGEHAALLGAHREAAEQYARALRFAGGLPSAQMAELYSRRSRECYYSDQAEEALAAMHSARRCYADAGDRRAEGAAIASLSSISWCPGAGDDAISFGREAVEILESLEPGTELCEAYLTLAFVHARRLDAAASAAWLARAADLADELGDDTFSIDVEITRARLAVMTLSPDALEMIDRARERAERLGLTRYVGWAQQVTADAALAARNWSRLDASVEDGLRVCRELGDDLDAKYLHASAAQGDVARGRWDDAIERSELILMPRSVSTFPRTIAHVVIGLVRARRGDPGAQDSLDEAHRLAERAGELPRLALVAAARAEHAWLRGRPEEVRGLTDPVLQRERRLGDAVMISDLLVWRRRAGVDDSVPADVVEPYAHELAGDWARAATQWRELGCPYDAAVALAGSSDPDALQEAHRELTDLGARPAAAIVARRIRELGAGGVRRGPRRSTTANPALLTTREVEVLQLLSTGLRNKQIAARLHLSAKTVDHHVAAVLRKLGVQTRGEATAAAARLGLIAPEAV